MPVAERAFLTTAQLAAAIVVGGEHDVPCRRIEETVVVDRYRIEELAGIIEDWLLHAADDTHRDLAGLGNMNRNPVGRLIDELGGPFCPTTMMETIRPHNYWTTPRRSGSVVHMPDGTTVQVTRFWVRNK